MIPWPTECLPHLLKYQQLAPFNTKDSLPTYYDTKAWQTECPAELVKYLNQENNTSNVASDVNVPPNPPDAAQARIGVFPIQM